MPAESQHLNQADRNESCFQSLSRLGPSRFTEWEVITLFYSALHHIEAYLARNGIDFPHPLKHAERRSEMVRHPDLDPILENYFSLHDYSEDARYNLVPFSESQVELLHRDQYLPIRETVGFLLGR